MHGIKKTEIGLEITTNKMIPALEGLISDALQ